MRRTRRLGRTTALVAVAMAVAAPSAWADPNRPRPTPPATSPGLDRSGVDRPDEARDPQVGPQNPFLHGNPPA